MVKLRGKSGRLILVVGASRAGKDTALRGAQARAGDDFVFPRRDITRPPDPEREDFRPVSRLEFALRWLAGGYALSWDRHGSWYGVPREIETHLAAGRSVVVNVSKGILNKARSRYPGLLVVWVRTDLTILEERLRNTPGETADRKAERLADARKYEVTGPDVTCVWNNGTKEECVDAFLAAIRS